MNCQCEKSLWRQFLRAPAEPVEATLYLSPTGWECLTRLADGRVIRYHRQRVKRRDKGSGDTENVWVVGRP